ncbi:MAG: hypothetical protein PHT32_08520, partial [Candidatus Omnitrophica bacterium]|nr:hypothetical protein [Candidatus Omnitrophota bacterium]
SDDKPVMRVSVDRRNILIGDRVRYTVSVKYREGLELEFPNFKEGVMGDFEIKDFGSIRKKGIFGNRSISRWYSITSFSVGKHEVPQYDLRYKKKGEKDWNNIHSEKIVVVVESILPEGAALVDIKDIKGPMSIREIDWALVAIVFFIFGIAGVAAQICIKRLRMRPPRPPHEVALEELEAINALLARTGDIKEFYIGISDSIRRYIESVFRLKAPEMTTEEFLNSLNDSAALTASQKEVLKEFMSACDLVKFAKYTPRKDEIESVFTAAKKFIGETTYPVVGKLPQKV